MLRPGLPILFINMRTYWVQYAEAQWLSRRETVACTRMLLCTFGGIRKAARRRCNRRRRRRKRTRTCGTVEPKPAPFISHYNANRLEARCAAASSYSIGHLFRYLNIVRSMGCTRVVCAFCSQLQPAAANSEPFVFKMRWRRNKARQETPRKIRRNESKYVN